MHRRRFLATVGTLTPAGFAGCSALANDGRPDRPWPPGEVVDDPSGTHDLYVENHLDTTEAAWLRVVREDDVVLVDGRYELPDGRAIRFDDLARWETAYTIELAIDGDDSRSLEWYTAECGPDSEAPDGSRNAAVRVEQDEGDLLVGLRMDECDAIIAGSLPTGAADVFRLDE